MELAWLIEKLDKPSKHVDGEITLRSQTHVWNVHLVRGQVLYVTGGVHPVRRWDRASRLHCPNWNWGSETSQLPDKQYWECQVLDRGINQNQLSLVRAKLVIRSSTQECLFELSSQRDLESHWQLNKGETWMSCQSIALSSWEMQSLLSRTMKMRQDWQAAGLEQFSPTFTPVLQFGSGSVSLPVPGQYLNGKSTLWDIAAQLEKSVVEVGQSLLPWIEKHVLTLQPIADLPLLPTVKQPAAATHAAVGVPLQLPVSPPSELPGVVPHTLTDLLPTAIPQQQPIIACIDDSPVLAYALRKILVSNGYQMLSIQEPMRGFTQLIDYKPDLILLDLLLPNADGYSICKFLRDTPVFKKTPIIILTGQNTPIDRARAMLAGATAFLGKPPQPEELLQMIRKHLGKL
jgi:two-component system, chemotaxis family, response regulator PixG